MRYRLLAICLLLLPDIASLAAEAIQPERRGVDPVSLGAPNGLNGFVPGRWGTVKYVVRNGSDQDASLKGTVHFKNNPDLRFARNLWVPARSVRSSWIPMYLPSDIEPDGPLEIVGTANSADDSTAGAVRTRSLARRLVPDSMVFLGDREFAVGPDGRNTPYETVLAMRGSLGLPRRMSMMDGGSLPSTIEGWDGVSNVVIAGDRLATDSAAQVALRQWLAEGGRLWLQLNRVSDATTEALLGSGLRMQVVDRVPLNSFTVTLATNDTAFPTRVDREDPVELLRVLIEDAEVIYEVDGWPAAFVLRYGRGEVLVTTLDAHGWMRPRGMEDSPQGAPEDPRFYTDFVALDPLHRLGSRFIEPRPETRVADAVTAGYISDRIGYEIPPRGLILSILAGFCFGIAAVGTMLMFWRRLEHLSWIAAVLGAAATVAVVAAGWSSRQSVPPSVSEIQIVHVLPETTEFLALGSVASFRPELAPVDMASTSGGRINPAMPDLAGKIRLLEWSDNDSWHWTGTAIPPGVRTIETFLGGALETPITATAQIGPAGLVGRLSVGDAWGADTGAPTDGILAFPFDQPLAANLRSDGSFAASADDQLAVGQFFTDAMLDDEQRRRHGVLDAWMAGYQNSQPAGVPMMLAWIDSPQRVLDFGEPFLRTGACLLTVPLEIQRTPPNSQVAIPSPLITSTAVRSSVGQSTIYDNHARRWRYPHAQPSLTRLRYQIPDAVLPMRLAGATLRIDCNIPSRDLDVYLIDREARRKVLSRTSPSGRVNVDLNPDDGLTLDAGGGVMIEFHVGDLHHQVDEQTMANSGWSIRSTRLSVEGQTLPLKPDAETLETAGGR